jgi:hypothetical protein
VRETGEDLSRELRQGEQGGLDMNLVRRIAIAVGSLLALALAGGAHYKL